MDEKYLSEIQTLHKLYDDLIKRITNKKYKIAKLPNIILGEILLEMITNITGSYLRLLPNSPLYFGKEEHWDIPSIASLTRNIMENFNVYYYLSVEKTEDDERILRLTICELHSEVERLKMYFELEVDQQTIDNQKKKTDTLRAEIIKNTFFQQMDELKKIDILKGNKAYYLSHKEITRRVKLGIEDKEIDFIYRYTSNFIHTSPFSMERFGSKEQNSNEEAKETAEQLIKITNLFLEYTLKLSVEE